MNHRKGEEKKKNLYKDCFCFCFGLQMFMGLQFNVWGGQEGFEGHGLLLQPQQQRKPSLCSVSFQLCPPIHLWPSYASLTKTLGLEGRGDRNPSAYYVAFHVLHLSLSCLD